MKIHTVASFLCLCLWETLAGGTRSGEECMSFEASLTASDLVEKILRDPRASIEIRNVKASDHPCFKHFTNGHAMGVHETTRTYLVPDEGVLLSTGTPEDFCWSDSDEHSFGWGIGGDEDLTELMEQTVNEKLVASESSYAEAGPQVTYDACEIEFEFRCTDGSPIVQLSYMFGSEEYFEDDTSGDYKDVFALFLNGDNIALLPNGDTVSIDNVNCNTNSEYFVSNDADSANGHPYEMIEADGFTTQLRAEGKLNRSNAWNTMKLAVADKADNILDSYLLIKQGSFTCAGGRAGSSESSVRTRTIGRDPRSDEAENDEILPEVALQMWYPSLSDPENPYACVFGSDYDDWMKLPSLNIQYLFESEEDCCDVHYCEEASDLSQ